MISGAAQASVIRISFRELQLQAVSEGQEVHRTDALRTFLRSGAEREPRTAELSGVQVGTGGGELQERNSEELPVQCVCISVSTEL